MNPGTKENKTNLSALGLCIELKAEIFVLQKRIFLSPSLSHVFFLSLKFPLKSWEGSRTEVNQQGLMESIFPEEES